MAFTCGNSLALSRSTVASMSIKPSLSSTLCAQKAHQSKLDVRLARSQLFGSASTLLKLVACRYSPNTRGVNLASCSAERGEEESAESSVQARVPEVTVPQFIDEVSKRLQPFLHLARVDKRWLGGGWLLFLWPFYWGAALAAENGSGPDLRILALLAVASAILRSAACTVNDLCDKDFDGKVERTKLRPIVTGVVTPLQGWAFLGAQILLYLVVLSQLEAFRLGSQFQVQVAIQLFLNCTYPLAKRWTHWTPMYLGLAINWGAFLGWAAVRGTGDLASTALLPAFFAAWCWTFVYETIYAHQDIKDDVKAGIKSMAILLGKDTKQWLTGFGTAFVASLSIAGHNTALGWPFYAGVAAAAALMAWQITSVDIENPADCEAKFRANKLLGASVFGGIVCGKLLV